MTTRTRFLATIPLIWLFFWLAISSMAGDSPTMDEQNHLARGVAYLKTGDPRLSVEHPPLVNGLSALPVVTLPDLVLPLADPSWQERFPPMTFWYTFAERFMWQLGNDVDRMVFLGRLPIVFLTLGLALLGLVVAQSLWGRPAGWWAFAFLLFDPNLIAHGRYITTDLGGAFFIFLATWAIWRLFAGGGRPAWRLVAASLAIGLAFSAKLTSLAFIPGWILLVFLPPRAGREPYGRGAARRLGLLAAAGLASLLVVWAVYLFEWGSFLFIDDRLRWLNDFRGPMPTFWSGIERVTLLSGGGRPSFLWGAFSTEGFWTYFPIAFAVKTPLLILALLLGTAAALWQSGGARRRALWWGIPPAGYFLLTLNSGLNIGYRHLLPILPFIYVVIAGWCGRWLPLFSWRRSPGGHLLLLFSSVIAAGILVPALWIYPHYLSYFNPLAGGPANGYFILVDSNVDWGQDLFRLRDWMAENDVDAVKLAWFGTADPAYYGIPVETLPGVPYGFNLWWEETFDRQNPPPGIYAISVTNLWELPLRPEEKTVFAYFRAREPDDRVGYSLLIYRVGAAADG